MRRVVTIDGPAGAGKSTVARRIAERLGWRFLDTGAMYRAVTFAALRAQVDLSSDEALGCLAETLEVQLPSTGVLLNGEDVTGPIREPAITASSRYIADSPSVRARLVAWQRVFAADFDTVTEGRDQGTIVFPDAYRKFYLTASTEERARRRLAELHARSIGATLEAVLADIADRDARDQARAIAPMRPAEDAKIIDSTGRSLDDVIDHLIECIHENESRS